MRRATLLLAKTLVADDSIREQINSFVSNKSGGAGSDTEIGTDVS